MTLKFIIWNIPSLEIEFLGDEDDLNQAKKVLSSSCYFQEGKSIDWEDENNPVYPSLKISTYNLYTNHQGQSVVQIMLKLIDNNKIIISPRHRYILQYWDYEVKMIISGGSKHKSHEKYKSDHLSSPLLLNAILNECEKKRYLPRFEQLFQFLDNSEKLKKDYLDPYLYFDKPYKFDLDEIQKFIKTTTAGKDNKIYGKSPLLLFDIKSIIFEDYIPHDNYRCVI